MNLNKLTRKHAKNTTWPKEKKIQAVTQYLALGNMKLVEATTGVSHGVLRQWKLQPWWKEYEAEIRNTENLSLDTDLTKIVNKSLEVVADRLEHGDFIYDSKTGEMKRKQVNMKDAAKVSTDLLTKRELLRGNATNRTEAVTISTQDQLKMLAEQFIKMTRNPQEIIDVETIEVIENESEEIPETGPGDEEYAPDTEAPEEDDGPEGDEPIGGLGVPSTV